MADNAYPLLFLDLETTGHDPLKLVNGVLAPWHEIIEIGGVFVEQRSLVKLDEFDMKVRPEHPERCLPNLVNDYPERAKRGEWDNAFTQRGAIWIFLGGYCAKMNSVMNSVVIPAGQNFFFDWSFLVVAFAGCGIDEKVWQKYLHYTRLDTRSMAVQELLKPDEVYFPNNYSLRNPRLSEVLGLPPEPYPHRALNGAHQAYLVYKALRELKRKRPAAL